jgi:hypothetical protein
MITLDPRIFSYSVATLKRSEVFGRGLKYNMVKSTMCACFFEGTDNFDNDIPKIILEHGHRPSHTTEFGMQGMEAATSDLLWFMPCMFGNYKIGCDQVHIRMNPSLLVDINNYKG